MRGVIAIVPFGSVSRSFCRELGQRIGDAIRVEVEILTSLGQPQYAHNPARAQYHSNAIVRRVGQAIDKRRHVAGVGVVDVDLFLPDFSFVLGQADRDEMSVVLSVTRMRPEFYGQRVDAEKTMDCALAEALHELGHVFGLTHCHSESCAMFFSNTLSDIDRKRGRYCDPCTDKLLKSMDSRFIEQSGSKSR